MSLNYEMARYTELTGEDGTKVPISRLGGYLDGYEKGRAEAIKEFKEFLQALAFGKRKGLVHWSDVENITKMMKEQKE